ncbi:MAG: DNA cytosine methyltransferase [Pseudomonadota bacterium]
MTFRSLFSGIGGFDLGLERTGMRCAWQVEIDKDCLTILSRHWPDVPKLHDIREVKGPELGAVDLVCGGFPCQDLSLAGRRAGLAGERSGLFFEFIRVVDELRPTWLVIENVPGLLSSNGGRDMATVVGTLGQLGYWWTYRVLDAQYFGVAQRRRRVFIVGNLGDRTAAAKVLLEPESCDGNPPPGRKEGADVARCIAARTRIDGDTESFVTQALTGHMGHGGPDDNEAQAGWLVAHTLRTNHRNNSNPTTEASMLVAHEDISGNLALADRARALRSGASHSYQVVAYGISNQPTPKYGENIAPSLDAKEDGGGRMDCVATANLVRRLTPTECERLQGFPDGHTEGVSDSARYRMLGNAVAVPVAEWLAHRIVQYEKARCDE